jgi:Short C-terminal domain
MGFRRRVRRRALVVGAVGGAAVAHHAAKRGQQQDDDQGPADDEAPADDQAQYAPPPADPADEIEHLAQLHSSGALSDEEFTAAKAKILGT